MHILWSIDGRFRLNRLHGNWLTSLLVIHCKVACRLVLLFDYVRGGSSIRTHVISTVLFFNIETAGLVIVCRNFLCCPSWQTQCCCYYTTPITFIMFWSLQLLTVSVFLFQFVDRFKFFMWLPNIRKLHCDLTTTKGSHLVWLLLKRVPCFHMLLHLQAFLIPLQLLWVLHIWKTLGGQSTLAPIFSQEILTRHARSL